MLSSPAKRGRTVIQTRPSESFLPAAAVNVPARFILNLPLVGEESCGHHHTDNRKIKTLQPPKNGIVRFQSRFIRECRLISAVIRLRLRAGTIPI